MHRKLSESAHMPRPALLCPMPSVPPVTEVHWEALSLRLFPDLREALPGSLNPCFPHCLLHPNLRDLSFPYSDFLHPDSRFHPGFLPAVPDPVLCRQTGLLCTRRNPALLPPPYIKLYRYSLTVQRLLLPCRPLSPKSLSLLQLPANGPSFRRWDRKQEKIPTFS